MKWGAWEGGGGGALRLKGQKVQNAVLAPIMVFSLKRSAAEAFVVPFRVSSRENVTGGNVFF